MRSGISLWCKKSAGFSGTLCCVAALFIVASDVTGQDFGLAISNTPSPIAVDDEIAYHLMLTNASVLEQFNVQVASEFAESATIVSATNAAGSVSESAGVVLFTVDRLASGEYAEMAMAIKPTEGGAFTNHLNVTGLFPGLGTPSVPLLTNVVTTVLAETADLGVRIPARTSTLFVNDFFTYPIVVTNAGPDAATDVMVTNPLPATAVFLGVADRTNTTWRILDDTLLFSISSLATQELAWLEVTVQPTNADPIVLAATVASTNIVESQPGNNTFSTNAPVLVPNTNQLLASTVSTQQLNLQTGFMEQRVVLSNASPQAVEAARVVVVGITNMLANAAGTNAGNPFVTYGEPLAAGESVDLTLVFFEPSRTNFPIPGLTAHATPSVDLSPLPGAEQPITGIARQSSGRVMLQFGAAVGRRYQVVYSQDAGFGNPLGAVPPFTTRANQIQWIDYGPPTTAGTNASSRFYKVIELP